MAVKVQKRMITERWFLDGNWVRDLEENRTVYLDTKGEFIRTMGNKKYLTGDSFESHSRSMRAYSLQDVLNQISGKKS